MSSVEDRASVLPDRDRRIIEDDQPELQCVPGPDGSVAFVGDFVFKLASGSPQRIPTRIEFTARYPDEEPRAFDIGPRFRHDGNHHFYTNGRCCLWLDVETRWKPSDPERLLRFLDELKVYYVRQLMMEANPKLTWPGRARGHGSKGHLEHLVERLRMPLEKMPIMLRALGGGGNRNAPCPCGRRVRYRKCHRNVILRFRKLADPGAQAEVANTLRKVKTAEPARRKALRDRRAAPSQAPQPPRSSQSPAGPRDRRVGLDAVLATMAAGSSSRAPA